MVNDDPDAGGVAQQRYENALLLFEEFVQATVRHPDAAALRGLERRFAEQLLIQPSYWSQIKARTRQIGERLARQFEQRCRKPPGWMDAPHGQIAKVRPTDEPLPPPPAPSTPQDDDERFIVGLVLSYYRRHPQRARVRLLDLLGEVLTPPPAPPAPPGAPPAPAPGAGAGTPAPDEAGELLRRSLQGVAPLKRRR
ncbi:MAG: hypothetical protein ACOYLV_11055 [Rubrivivax sp.]